jgi:hypothetical protein
MLHWARALFWTINSTLPYSIAFFLGRGIIPTFDLTRTVSSMVLTMCLCIVLLCFDVKLHVHCYYSSILSFLVTIEWSLSCTVWNIVCDVLMTMLCFDRTCNYLVCTHSASSHTTLCISFSLVCFVVTIEWSLSCTVWNIVCDVLMTMLCFDRTCNYLVCTHSASSHTTLCISFSLVCFVLFRVAALRCGDHSFNFFIQSLIHSLLDQFICSFRYSWCSTIMVNVCLTFTSAFTLPPFDLRSFTHLFSHWYSFFESFA